MNQTLSDNQLDMAWTIAQYDVQAAYRYCLNISARNQHKCPLCGSELVLTGGKDFNYGCPRYSRGVHQKIKRGRAIAR